MFGPIRRAKLLRRGGQLVLGAAVGALLTADVVSELLRLLPVMIAMAVSLNAVGAFLAFPVAQDRRRRPVPGTPRDCVGPNLSPGACREPPPARPPRQIGRAHL